MAETLPARLLPTRVALVSPATRPEWSEAAPKFRDITLGSLSTVPTVIVGRSVDTVRTAPLADLAAEWGAPFVEIPGSGHLTPADGHGPFPGALAWVLGGRDDMWAGAGVGG
jgi:predicted alpha/beta hydrolase family esterase